MAKYTSNLLNTCRIQLRLDILGRQFSCNLCRKSYPSTCVSSIVRLTESRRFSTNRLVFQQKQATFLSTSGSRKSNVGKRTDTNVIRLTEQEQLLHSVIKNGESLSSADWDELKCKVFRLRGSINSSNFDAVAMGFCVASKQYKIGLSLFDHLASLGKEANVATLSRFLKLCYVCHSAPAPKDVQAVIASVYSKLRSVCSLMDGHTAENAVHGLVLTDKWKEGLELLSMIKLTDVPSSSIYNALAKAAFDYNEVDAGWELINEMVLNDRRPTPSTYCAVLNFCSRCPNKDDGHKMVEKLLSFLADHDLRPTKDVAENLLSWFKKENPNWEGSMTTLNNKGLCKNCKNNLNSAITEEQFGALQSCFMDRVVIGSNVFQKTTPEELKAFQKFLKQSVPFDVVLDGLNVAYVAKSTEAAPHSAYLLQTVVKHFVDKSQKVVLFGRKHMRTWPKKPMNYIFSNTKTFLTDNISQDDPFLLYAAMYGGLGTSFVSRDQMRGHVFRLKDPSLKIVFRRWQEQHQYFILRIDAERGDVYFKPPLSYSPVIQRRADGGWHIPYDEEVSRNPLQPNKQTLDPPQNWLCIGPGREKTIKTT